MKYRMSPCLEPCMVFWYIIREITTFQSKIIVYMNGNFTPILGLDSRLFLKNLDYVSDGIFY